MVGLKSEIYMLIVAIIGGMGLGYIVGNYFLDKWINEIQEEIDGQDK